MDPRLQELIDHHEIKKLIDAYAAGCDRFDGQRMASPFHSDSWVDHGAEHCTGQAFVAHIMERADGVVAVSHLQSQAQIEINGDTAGAETYFQATIKPRRSDGVTLLNFMGGRYIDWLEKENGQWRIKKRVCIKDWSFTQLVEQDVLSDRPWIEGVHSGEDASYAALGLQHTGARLEHA
jgi:hypothetical protein